MGARSTPAEVLEVLADTLGEDFTPAALASWERAFHLMASVMMEGSGRSEGAGQAVRRKQDAAA